MANPLLEFHSGHYLRHTQRRQEHLATLGLPLAGRTVLEVGAGVGDHSTFFLDRGCDLTISEVLDQNLRVLRERLPGQQIWKLDLDAPEAPDRTFEVVYAYGLLYHLSRPVEAIEFMAERCSDLLLVETCVSHGDEAALHMVEEDRSNPSQAASGTGCRPTRRWVMDELGRHFPFVYVTVTQPWHEEFPLDWSSEPNPGLLTRAVFVASRSALDNSLLTRDLPSRQSRG